MRKDQSGWIISHILKEAGCFAKAEGLGVEGKEFAVDVQWNSFSLAFSLLRVSPRLCG